MNYSVFNIPVLLLFTFLSGCGQKKAPLEDSKSSPPLDVEIGQMLMVGFRGLKADKNRPIVHDIQKYHIGGVVLFDYDVPAKSPIRNIRSPKQTEKLISQLQSYTDIPLLIGIDQEGGKVNRLKHKYGFPSSVSAQYLGNLDNADSTRKYAAQTAKTLTELGINLNLAPDIDVNINPDNPVIGSLERSFSADPQIVANQAEIYISTLHSYDIITALKHFPGHGSSKEDSHKGLVDVTQTWQQKELIPYRKLINAGNADIIMTAHIFNARLDSAYPATLSEPTITGLLRDSLNFSGVVMSDDMQMGAIRSFYGMDNAIEQCIKAGVDILVFANNSIFDKQIASKAHSMIKKLVENGTISKERIDQSYQRIMRLKKKYLSDKK